MKLGLALGAGGASGLAHILVLEVLDELGIRPHHVAGTSIGALIGALYASGMSAREIRALAESLAIRDGDSWRDILGGRLISGWRHLLDPAFGRGGLIDGADFLGFLCESVEASRFDELELPLSVVATEFWEREQVVFDSGEFRPAVQASMAMPGLFTPVPLDGHLLVDGGAVNPVPFDVLADDCDLTLAVDAISRRSQGRDLSTFDVVFNTFQIMQQSIVTGKRRYRPPDIYLESPVHDIRALEFHRLDEILRQARPLTERLQRDLGRRLEAG